MADADRKALIPVLNALAEKAPARILATSRAVGYQPGLLPLPSGNDAQKNSGRLEMRVLDLDWAGTDEFFRKFFGDSKETAEKLSADFIHDAHSCVFDASSGIELNSRLFKLACWYDNEWGYSNRVVDLMICAASKGL